VSAISASLKLPKVAHSHHFGQPRFGLGQRFKRLVHLQKFFFSGGKVVSDLGIERGELKIRIMLLTFSAGGLSSLLAADPPGVVGLDPFDRTMFSETERLGFAVASRLRTEALLLRTAVALQRRSRCSALGHRAAGVVAR